MKRNPSRGHREMIRVSPDDWVVQIPDDAVDPDIEKWTSLRGDFRRARLALDALGSTINNLTGSASPLRSFPDVVRAALVTEAVVSYARPFASGVRSPLKREETLRILSREGDAEVLVEGHDAFVGLRNKHVAHSVSPLEQVLVTLTLEPGSVRGVRSIDHRSFAFSSPNHDDLRLLDRLAFIFEAECSVNLSTLLKPIGDRAWSDLEWAYSLPKAAYETRDFFEDVKRVRRQHPKA